MNAVQLKFVGRAALVVLLLAALVWGSVREGGEPSSIPAGRKEVVFWHFWGGKDRQTVEDIVRRFNASQQEHYVRAVAMPGTNLDLKFFLSVAGGDPPDLLNQDDPVVADWAHRGAILPLEELATPAEIEELNAWLFPAARQLGSYHLPGREAKLYALCNGLDIRALYVNETTLDKHGLAVPQTLAQLDQAALAISPIDVSGPRTQFGYLPDPRRLWAWGIVFGGDFYDEQTGQPTVNDPRIVAALEWMTGYRQKYGAKQVSDFRKGDQALTGATSPLLAGKYAMLMDGQWRVSEISAAEEFAAKQGEQIDEFTVTPLPPPPGGFEKAGWVNGNFFVVPRGAKNAAGAWAFMKFWSGFGGHAAEAARTCIAGGWIPASGEVVRQAAFQEYLQAHPRFALFVDLASSPHQVPTPAVPGAAFFYDEVVRAAEESLYRDDAPPPRELLDQANARIARHLEELLRESP